MRHSESDLEQPSGGDFDLPDTLVIVCGAQVDERNGAGLRVLIDYLRELPRKTAVVSLHSGEGVYEGQHAVPNLRYYAVSPAKTAAGTPRLIIEARRAVSAIARGRTRLLCLPSSSSDIVLCCAALTSGHPADVWFMDDFLSASTSRFFPKKAALQWCYRQLYRRASRRIVIGEAMRLEYARRYGRSAETVLGKAWPRAAMELARSLRRERGRVDPEAPVRLIWPGTYLPYYREPIRQLARILRARPELPIFLDLFGMFPPETGIADGRKIRYRGSFRDDELPKLLAGYDYGLLCYSSDAATMNFMRWSFPGKLADYVCAGLPVAGIVPKDIHLCGELERDSRNVIIDSIGPSEIDGWVTELRRRRNCGGLGASPLVFEREAGLKALIEGWR
jgi:hypothetical protein